MKRYLGFLAFMVPSLVLASLSVTPPPITPPAITPPSVTFQSPPVQPAAVQPPAIVVTDAQMITQLQADGYTVTLTPPPVVGPTALAWPFTALVSTPAAPVVPGKTLVSYTATGVGNASFMTGTSMHSPFMVQGINGAWGGGSMAFALKATYSDGSTASLGTTPAIALQATNGTVVPQNGLMYSAGMFFGKGDFNNNVTADYAFADPIAGTNVIALKSLNNVGMIFQPYFPVTSTVGFNTAAYKNLSVTIRTTIAGHAYAAYFMADNDVADGVSVPFGGSCPVGVYCTYSLALSSFKLTNPQILKYAIVDGTNVPNGSMSYVSDMHFN